MGEELLGSGVWRCESRGAAAARALGFGELQRIMRREVVDENRMTRRSPNQHPPAPGSRIAAVDVGSNSVRLVVAEVLATGGYRVLDEERENTRLASALVATGRLDPAAVTATLIVLRHFLSIAGGLGATTIRAIGTSALRDAEDGAEFCERVRNELQLEIDVIPSEEEARLAFLSVARAFDISGREVAVTDIGGGSTEIVLASSGIIDQIYSTRLGAVRVTDRCDTANRSTERRLAKLRAFIDRALEKQIGRPPFIPDMLIGTGGTFTALAAMVMARQGQAGQPMWGYRVTRAQIRHLIADLAEMTLEKRRKVTGLSPDRADIIVAGIAVVERIMRQLHVNVVQVHTRGVRDGLLLTMVQQAPPAPVAHGERRTSVEEFARNCGVDLAHTCHVARLAGSLWEQLAAPLSLRGDDRELIETAAILANCGYLINFEGHHKHSLHLILNSELPGFERGALQIIANVARYHRGAPPKRKHEHFAELSREDQQRVTALAAVLRLALALDRTHQQHIDAAQVRVDDDEVQITVRSREDTGVDLWAAERKVELFEKIFGRKVHFAARRTRGAPRRRRATGAESRGAEANAPAGKAPRRGPAS